LIELRSVLLRRASSSSDAGAAATGPVRPHGWFSGRKELVLNHLFAVPDQQASWLRPAARHAAALEKEPPDVVLATGSPWTGLLAGLQIAEQLRVPFVADFRDPWTRNPYGDRSWPSLAARARRLERHVCSRARLVVANTDELRQQFEADYADMRGKFVTITNGYDDSGALAGRASDAVASTSQTELWHFGSIYGKRDPLPLLAALKELADAGALASHSVKLRFVGGWDLPEDRDGLAAELEARGLLVREPPISHEQCLHEMRRAPALLVVQPDSPLQVPAKLYEYVSSGRPIVVVGGDGATANLVNKHQLGVTCRNDAQALGAFLRRIVAANGVHAGGAAARSAFQYRQLTERLASMLDEVTAQVRVEACA